MSLLSYIKKHIYKTKMPVDIRNHTKNMNIYIGICMTYVHIGCFPISNKMPMFSQFQLTTGWCWDSSGQFERLWRSLMKKSNGKIWEHATFLGQWECLKSIGTYIGGFPRLKVQVLGWKFGNLKTLRNWCANWELTISGCANRLCLRASSKVNILRG